MRYSSLVEGSRAKQSRSKPSSPRTHGFCFRGEKLWDETEKLRREDRHRLLSAQLGDRSHEVEATQSVLAVVAKVVEKDQRTVGPAAEDRMIQLERLDDGLDVVGPQLRIAVAVARLVRETMASQIQRDQPVLSPPSSSSAVGSTAASTARCRGGTRIGTTPWGSGLHDMQLGTPPPPGNSVSLHRGLPVLRDTTAEKSTARGRGIAPGKPQHPGKQAVPIRSAAWARAAAAISRTLATAFRAACWSSGVVAYLASSRCPSCWCARSSGWMYSR